MPSKCPPLSMNIPGQHWTGFPRNSLYLGQKKSHSGFLWAALDGELVVKGTTSGTLYLSDLVVISTDQFKLVPPLLPPSYPAFSGPNRKYQLAHPGHHIAS